MRTKFAEDVIPLTDLKTNPGKVVKHVSNTKRPVLVTSRGRGVAVVQSLSEYERREEELQFMRGVVNGLLNLNSGGEVELSKARQRFQTKD